MKTGCKASYLFYSEKSPKKQNNSSCRYYFVDENEVFDGKNQLPVEFIFAMMVMNYFCMETSNNIFRSYKVDGGSIECKFEMRSVDGVVMKRLATFFAVFFITIPSIYTFVRKIIYYGQDPACTTF